MIIEVILKDTRGWCPGAQYILHAGQVVWFGDSFQIVQITEIHFMHNYWLNPLIPCTIRSQMKNEEFAVLLRKMWTRNGTVNSLNRHQKKMYKTRRKVSHAPKRSGQDPHMLQFYLNRISSKSNGYSIMPVVGTLTRRMSCSVGK